ncbi:hypothetical protein TNCV_1281321 [Trichonephila clavipes]|nr:hypothetical protein TNCV_1281321 [Trichonephila clavipes]
MDGMLAQEDYTELYVGYQCPTATKPKMTNMLRYRSCTFRLWLYESATKFLTSIRDPSSYGWPSTLRSKHDSLQKAMKAMYWESGKCVQNLGNQADKKRSTAMIKSLRTVALKQQEGLGHQPRNFESWPSDEDNP